MSRSPHLLSASVSSLLFLCSIFQAQAGQTDFPPDTGMVNIKEPPYNAVGDGVTDDTAAIQAAINANVGRLRVLYFPSGTYLVRDTLSWRRDNGDWACYLGFQGQDRTGTVIKLADNCPGFGNITYPKAVIMTASENAYTTTVNDNTIGTGLHQCNYSGVWSYEKQAAASLLYSDDHHYTSTTDAAVTVRFIGSKVELRGTRANNLGIVAVSIDGGPETEVDLYAAAASYDQPLWTSPPLDDDQKAFEHTIRVRCTGTKNASSTGLTVSMDRIVATTPGEGNQAFMNSIANLTVDTGTGNPAAIGVDYMANNQGSIEEVNIQGSGIAGLAMTRRYPGPCSIKNVGISGFKHGVNISRSEYSVVFENLELANQAGTGAAGINNSGNVLTIRKITSNNAVPAIKSTGATSMITVMDANFTGSPGASAIDLAAGTNLYARNVVSTGYDSAIKGVPGNAHFEYKSNAMERLFPSPDSSLFLPVQETPVFHDNNMANWVSVVAHGANPADTADDSAAIQAAIDQPGATTVYFPSSINGKYAIKKTIEVRGTVKRIVGFKTPLFTLNTMDSDFRDIANPKPVFKVNGNNDVIIEGIRTWTGLTGGPGTIWIEQATAKSVTLKHAILGGGLKQPHISTPGAGKFFIEDVAAGSWRFDYPQDIWARQLNPETNGLKIRNNGARLWILGLKTENPGTVIETVAGGKTELLGGLLYPTLTVPTTHKAFINTESAQSLIYAVTSYGASNDYTIHVEETRGGVTRTLLRTDIPRRMTNGSFMPLYAGGYGCSHATSSGDGNSMGLRRTDSSLWSWGFNSGGRLGDGTEMMRKLPVRAAVPAVSTAATGGGGSEVEGYGIAVQTGGGQLWSWGKNTYGQLGNGTTATSLMPAPLAGFTDVRSIGAGTYHVAVLKNDGRVWTWGRNHGGQLGDGTTTTRLSPQRVENLDSVVAIASGAGNTVALKSDGSVWLAGGWNGNGNLNNNPTFAMVTALSNIVAIASGETHVMALKSDGTVWAWGNNAYGQLGDNTVTRRLSPVQVSLSNVVAIAAGANHSLAVLTDGTVRAWGRNDYGQVGDGTLISPQTLPIQVQGSLSDVVRVGGGKYHSHALKADGTIWSWGRSNSGQLGNDTTPLTSSIPVQVLNLNLDQ